MLHPSDFSQHFIAQEARLARQAAERQAAALEALAESRALMAPEDIAPAPSHGANPPLRIAELPDTLDVKQAALVLGLKPQTIYDWVAARRLPCLRAGRAVRFDKTALLGFRQRQIAHPEPADRVSINLRRPRLRRPA